MSKGKLIAFDGLPSAGKSTFAAMFKERVDSTCLAHGSLDDLHQPATQALEKSLWNDHELPIEKAIESTAEAYPFSATALQKAYDYGRGYLGLPGRIAMIAYMRAMGKQLLDIKVRQLNSWNNVILDTWTLTDLVYLPISTNPRDAHCYTWSDMRFLYKNLGISEPDSQYFLTLPLDQINLRRAFRDGVDPSSRSKEPLAKHQQAEAVFKAIKKEEKYLRLQPRKIDLENLGSPIQSLRDQIAQADRIFLPQVLYQQSVLCGLRILNYPIDYGAVFEDDVNCRHIEYSILDEMPLGRIRQWQCRR